MVRHSVAVTTRANPSSADISQAESVAARWRVPLLARSRQGPLSRLFARCETLLVVERAGVSLWDVEGSARWSKGLAALRLKALDVGGQGEALVSVGKLAPGERILDCTLGLAQDARVAARLVGPKGSVLGLEASLPLAMLAQEGLRREETQQRSATIDVRHADFRPFLKDAPVGSFDVVLFDPMFSRERGAQPSFALVRRLAQRDALQAETLAVARRVARRAVLVKAPRYGSELKVLGLRPEAASRSAPVVWVRLEREA